MRNKLSKLEEEFKSLRADYEKFDRGSKGFNQSAGIRLRKRCMSLISNLREFRENTLKLRKNG